MAFIGVAIPNIDLLVILSPEHMRYLGEYQQQ
jgi:hypothetical protein